MVKMKKFHKTILKEDGFTLIETSIVLLVIAALSLLLLPNMTGVKNSVDGSTNKATVAAVEAQIVLYEMNNPGKEVKTAEDFIGPYVTQEQYDVYLAAKKN